jgi:hypothetical protein
MVAASDQQQAHPTQPVQRMALRAVMECEPGLGERPGNVMGQRCERITGGQRAAVAVTESGRRVRQFCALGECL